MLFKATEAKEPSEGKDFLTFENFLERGDSWYFFSGKSKLSLTLTIKAYGRASHLV